MKVTKIVNDDNITLQVAERVDTTTAPQLQYEIDKVTDETNKLVLDFKELIYVSSAGLRVLLSAHKTMLKKEGSLVITNVSEDILEIFEVTGFSDILTIE
ncbi:MAG: STAS domain-containing protein [Ruminococcus sp.]|nr:STAS domain-containing protein [Ruminococcus sp.]MBR2305381.1 STAS domain-containing protein [Ruminococcus sp.]